MKYIFLFALAIVASSNVFSQGEDDNWIFGGYFDDDDGAGNRILHLDTTFFQADRIAESRLYSVKK